jgi:hypothetical protein
VIRKEEKIEKKNTNSLHGAKKKKILITKKKNLRKKKGPILEFHLRPPKSLSRP